MKFECELGDSFEFYDVDTQSLAAYVNKDGKEISLKLIAPELINY